MIHYTRWHASQISKLVENRSVLVTGADHGICVANACMLTAYGAKVRVNYQPLTRGPAKRKCNRPVGGGYLFFDFCNFFAVKVLVRFRG